MYKLELGSELTYASLHRKHANSLDSPVESFFGSSII